MHNRKLEIQNPDKPKAVSFNRFVIGSFSVERGYQSFCEGHGTRYWRITFANLKRRVFHYIETFSNDLRCNKKYHCYIDYGGCVGERTFETDDLKEAGRWLCARVKNYR